MRRHLIALAVGGLLLIPTTADAGNANEAFLGDLNGDGRTDRVTFAPGAYDHTCDVRVQYRNVDGTFPAATTHTYTSIIDDGPECPNMGEVVDLGGDGTPEIIATHFWSYDPSGNLTVLRNFEPVARFAGVGDPNTLRKADFDGDGLVDIWQTSDETMRLAAFRNTAQGTLVAGPFDVCSTDSVPQHVLADLDGDGGQDFLVSRRCGYTNYAELYFGDGGTPHVFAQDFLSTGYAVAVVDQNTDGIPDVKLTTTANGTATDTYYLNNGSGVFTPLGA